MTIAETGLPGTPNSAFSPSRPKTNGLPGLIFTRQKRAAKLFEGSFHIIVFAHRNAAGRDHRVALGKRLLQCSDRRLERVRHQRKNPRLGVRVTDQLRQRQPVALVNAARAQLGARFMQFIARGQHPDDRLPIHAHLAHARGAEELQPSRMQAIADAFFEENREDTAWNSASYEKIKVVVMSMEKQTIFKQILKKAINYLLKTKNNCYVPALTHWVNDVTHEF